MSQSQAPNSQIQITKQEINIYKVLKRTVFETMNYREPTSVQEVDGYLLDLNTLFNLKDYKILYHDGEYLIAIYPVKISDYSNRLNVNVLLAKKLNVA